jgi:hypothetical protein
MRRSIDKLLAWFGYSRVSQQELRRLREQNEDLRRRLEDSGKCCVQSVSRNNHQRIDRSVRTVDGICQEVRALIGSG